MTQRGLSIDQRFDLHWMPEPMSGCFLWFGAHNEFGYGLIRDAQMGKNIRAHRFAYERENGAIPHGLEIDHLCRNKACVNPAHLEVVTHGENRRRVPREIQSFCVECGKEIMRKHQRKAGVVKCQTCYHREAVRKYDRKNTQRSYYQENREILLQKAKERYLKQKGG